MIKYKELAQGNKKRRESAREASRKDQKGRKEEEVVLM